MAPRLATVDPTLNEFDARAARGPQHVLLNTAASGPAIKASCGFLVTHDVEGEVALSHGDWNGIVLEAAIFHAECDDIVYELQEPGMAYTARLWEGLQAAGLRFEGNMAFPKLIAEIRAKAIDVPLEIRRCRLAPVNGGPLCGECGVGHSTAPAFPSPPTAIDEPLCDECGVGHRDPACDNNPPTCGAWYCSRGGPPCYGGTDACTCND